MQNSTLSNRLKRYSLHSCELLMHRSAFSSSVYNEDLYLCKEKTHYMKASTTYADEVVLEAIPAEAQRQLNAAVYMRIYNHNLSNSFKLIKTFFKNPIILPTNIKRSFAKSNDVPQSKSTIALHCVSMRPVCYLQFVHYGLFRSVSWLWG